MRTVVVLVVVAVLGWVFLIQKRHEDPKVAAAPTTKASTQTTTAAPRPVSEHNWMKRSLDRTNEVKRQVAEQRKQNATP